jgi:lia operon protein LiaF
VSNVFGDIEIDLRDAVMQPGESVLSVSGVFGDIDIIGLKGIPISVRGNVVFGDIRVFEEKRSGISNQIVNETPGYAQAVSKVRIYASQVFGEVRIR